MTKKQPQPRAPKPERFWALRLPGGEWYGPTDEPGLPDLWKRRKDAAAHAQRFVGGGVVRVVRVELTEVER